MRLRETSGNVKKLMKGEKFLRPKGFPYAGRFAETHRNWLPMDIASAHWDNEILERNMGSLGVCDQPNGTGL